MLLRQQWALNNSSKRQQQTTLKFSARPITQLSSDDIKRVNLRKLKTWLTYYIFVYYIFVKDLRFDSIFVCKKLEIWEKWDLRFDIRTNNLHLFVERFEIWPSLLQELKVLFSAGQNALKFTYFIVTIKNLHG